MVLKAMISFDQIVKMYFFGVLCLLLAVEAMPAPEQLHTNVPALPSSSEFKPDEKNDNNVEGVLVDPIPPEVAENNEKFDETEKELEPVEKPKEEKGKKEEKAEKKEIEEEKEEEKEGEKEVKDKLEDVVKVIEEFNDPKEEPKAEEPKEEPKEEQPKEEKKEEESKYEDVEEGPIIVEIFRPKPFLANIFSQFFPGFQWPHFSLPDFFRPKSADPLELDEPVYVVKESDFSWPYKK